MESEKEICRLRAGTEHKTRRRKKRNKNRAGIGKVKITALKKRVWGSRESPVLTYGWKLNSRRASVSALDGAYFHFFSVSSTAFTSNG